MSNWISQASLSPLEGFSDGTKAYGLLSPQFINKYFIISSPGTSRLMAYPEVTGFGSYLALLPATTAAMGYLSGGGCNDVDILTILRGGLNYPVEEACYRCGIRVRDIHFLSCERIIEDKVITGLEIKYEKLFPTPDRILVLGDIIASGETFRMCMEQVIELFRRDGGSIRKMIVFTIGGTMAVDLMEQMTVKIRKIFPSFEGFECFFYEGVFTVYTDKGVSGINVPYIDFGWKGGVVSPEFRRYILDSPETLLEKCIIYDGGARRYELPIHFHEVLEYWEGIRDRSDKIRMRDLLDEKLGYKGPLTYEKWLETNHFQNLHGDILHSLWVDEQSLPERFSTVSLRDIAVRRADAIQTILKQYE